MKLFFYSREQKVKKLDENGKAIPITIPVVKEVDGKETRVDEATGQFVQETKIRRDSFNVESVLRSYMISDDHIIVILNDGHEESQVVDQTLINAKKPPTKDNIKTDKARVFVASEISLSGDDAKRFFETFDV